MTYRIESFLPLIQNQTSTETAVYDFVNPDLARQAGQQIRRFLEE